MSVRTMARVWEVSGHAGSELLMLLAIADFSDDEGRAYPSVPTLAAKCRMSPRNANLILSALRASGELEIRHNEGPRGTNRYRIVTGVQSTSSLKAIAPLKGASPLKLASTTPEAGFPKPLKPASDEPSVNHHDPSKREPAKSGVRSSPKRSIPETWQPSSELKAWAKERRPDLDLSTTAEIFREHYIGKGEARASWDASFRTWVLRERATTPARAARSRNSGFADMDYSAGIGPNGEVL